MDTLDMTLALTLLAVLTFSTIGIGMVIGMVARADAHRVPVPADDRRPEIDTLR